MHQGIDAINSVLEDEEFQVRWFEEQEEIIVVFFG